MVEQEGGDKVTPYPTPCNHTSPSQQLHRGGTEEEGLLTDCIDTGQKVVVTVPTLTFNKLGRAAPSSPVKWTKTCEGGTVGPTEEGVTVVNHITTAWESGGGKESECIDCVTKYYEEGGNMKRVNFCNMVKSQLGMEEFGVDVNSSVTLDVQMESVNISQATEDVTRNVIRDVIEDVTLDVQLESDISNQVTEGVSQDVQLENVKYEDVILDVQKESKDVILDVISDVKCCATAVGTCSKHNIQLRKRKVRDKYWGMSKNGARWKYRWKISWHCSESGFEALPNQPGGKH